MTKKIESKELAEALRENAKRRKRLKLEDKETKQARYESDNQEGKGIKGN